MVKDRLAEAALDAYVHRPSHGVAARTQRGRSAAGAADSQAGRIGGPAGTVDGL